MSILLWGLGRLSDLEGVNKVLTVSRLKSLPSLSTNELTIIATISFIPPSIMGLHTITTLGVIGKRYLQTD